MFRFQSLDDDCTLEDEDEGLIEEEDEIDQFNDDTFGAGAIDDDWQEEHKRLAELDERDGLGLGGVGMGGDPHLGRAGDPSSPRLSSASTPHPLPSSLPSVSFSSSTGLPPPDVEDRPGPGGADLAESLARLILEADPAIAGVGAAERPGLPPSSSGPGLAPLQGLDRSRVLPQSSSIPHQHPPHPQHQLPPGPSTAGLPPAPPPSMLSYQQQHLLRRGTSPLGQMNSHSIWDNSMGFGPVSVSPGLVTHMEDSPLMSIIKEVGLPKRPPQCRNEEGRDLSERVPPPRSSSPVIGSPPVRAVPIGTPPKQPMSHGLNHQIHHPTAVHVRAPVQHRYPPPFPERLSPNTLLNIANSPLCRGPFPPGVGPVLSQIQRAQLLNSQVAGFPRAGPAPPLLPGGGGFRPFFGGPPPPHGHRMGPPPPHAPPNHAPPVRHNTTHLHPQHRRMLTQRMQSRGGDRGRTVGDRRSRDPYSNLMTQKEKEWVTKIQMMQLQSTDPYLDDYYYQNYYEKMEKRQERESDSSKKEHTTKLITPQVAKVEHTYRPVQFAGSLGKLTVSSVNNPRKMIDAVVTTRTDDEEKREKQVWNKRRQILYTVEKMYSLLLEVQDFEKRFVHTPEEDREALLEQHKTNTDQLCSSLREKEWDDRVSDEQCVMIMSVRKGKRLISRLLPLLPSTQAAAVVMAIARNLPALAKKDKQDQVLCWLVEPVSAVIQSLSSSALTDLLQELQGNEGQLVPVLHSKFGVTLLYLILSEGERMQSSEPNCQLMEDNRWTELVFSVTRELLSVPPSSLSPPLFTPPNLLSLFSRYVDRQRLDLLQDKLQISNLSR
ncbi:LOW QUALITY PROTEIN: protein PAT1 homolog 1-like [Sphaeramia orbicularis]|uniref:LOW QUALITY PROTEIN: protein PAT1 homolog 1-like n=1 Tax=Sphaeramia orbicularis TaxID=375764 RepID=UPI00117CB736|nr:LOW QUALITY PROTEIN: protein PAT1 homolog 1-like [Sphaeramia orbicularis]